MADRKKDDWTEDDVSSLPVGEHDYFDRKSGRILDDPKFEMKLGKHVSAMANSGGGHLLIGVDDNGNFDGVPQIRKGNQSTREWLEQKVPYLVDSSLQDIRVHQVKPAIPSLIPSNSVVIVIDIGDSALAPHQDIVTKVYYHRVGGHSVPAPHFYLRMLWARETFPNAKVVRAWFDTVMWPLLHNLNLERIYLERGKWSWVLNKESLNELFSLNNQYSPWHDNLSLLVDSYPTIGKEIESHDDLVAEVNVKVEELYFKIKNSAHLIHSYRETTSEDLLSQLPKKFPQDLTSCNTKEEIMRNLFGANSGESDHLATLASYVISQPGELPHGHNSRPLWNTNLNLYMHTLQHWDVVEFKNSADDSRNKLLEKIDLLFNLLTETRKELARRHGEPYTIL